MPAIIYNANIKRKKRQVPKMKQMLKRLWTEESGQGMAEYGLILALIAVVCIAAFTGLGSKIQEKIAAVTTGMTPPTTP